MQQSVEAGGVGATGALLWMTHALLREKHWEPRDEVAAQTQQQQFPALSGFAGDVNLLPTVRYALPPTADTAEAEAAGKHSKQENAGENDVHVRGITVGGKLFVHFVSRQKTARVGLTVVEYLKPCGASQDHSEAEAPSLNARILRCGKWRCNLETLRWRLERNLFSKFATADEHGVSGASSPTVANAAPVAELSRLPESLLLRVGSFLRAPELSHLTQTSKSLGLLSASPELWRQFLSQDFPMMVATDDPKTRYRQLVIQQQRTRAEEERWLQFLRERQLGNLVHFPPSLYGRWRGGGRLLAPRLYLPPAPPFLPPGAATWPLRQPHPNDLFDDDDLELFPDAFPYPPGPRLGLHFY